MHPNIPTGLGEHLLERGHRQDGPRVTGGDGLVNKGERVRAVLGADQSKLGKVKPVSSPPVALGQCPETVCKEGSSAWM